MTFVRGLLELAYRYFEHPWAILLIIPIIIVLYFLLKKTFVDVKEDPEVKQQKRKLKRIMFFTRVLLAVLLLVAIATPFVQTQKMIEGDAYIKLLVDNSTSMDLFQDFSAELAKALETHLTVEVKAIGTGEQSAIGDSVLNNLEAHDSILLISDGNVNHGSSLGDVALFASRLNSSINAISLNPVKNDAGVVIIGPAKTQEGVDNTFAVLTNGVGNVPYYWRNSG